MINLFSYGALRQTDARKLFNPLRFLRKPAELAEYQSEGHVPQESVHLNAAALGRHVVDFRDHTRSRRKVPHHLKAACLYNQKWSGEAEKTEPVIRCRFDYFVHLALES